MTALLLQFWPYVLAAVATLAGAWKWRQSILAAERAKQAQSETAARDIRDQVENDIGALPADKARERLGRWSNS